MNIGMYLSLEMLAHTARCTLYTTKCTLYNKGRKNKDDKTKKQRELHARN